MGAKTGLALRAALRHHARRAASAPDVVPVQPPTGAMELRCSRTPQSRARSLGPDAKPEGINQCITAFLQMAGYYTKKPPTGRRSKPGCQRRSIAVSLTFPDSAAGVSIATAQPVCHVKWSFA